MLPHHFLATAFLKYGGSAFQMLVDLATRGVAPPPYGEPEIRQLECEELVLDGDWSLAPRGRLYRNSPALREAMGLRYHHWFDGDGMVSCFTISGADNVSPNVSPNGSTKISHKARFVQTHKLKTETKRGRRVYPAFGTWVKGMTPMLTAPDVSNAANISVISHHQRLFALWEAGSAYELDPDTLKTISPVGWSWLTKGLPFGAHPTVDADGNLWNIGAAPWFGRLYCYQLDKSGRLKQSACHSLKQLGVRQMGMIHDFAHTKRFLVVLLSPYVMKPKPKASYLECHQWLENEPTQAVVIDKNNLNRIVARCQLPAGWVFHYGGAVEVGDEVRLDAFWYQNVAVMDATREPSNRQQLGNSAGSWTTIRLPLAGGEGSLVRGDFRGEFPIAADGGGAYAVGVGRGGLSKVARIGADGKEDSYDFGKDVVCEEHLFVEGGNGDGFLLGSCLDTRRNTTFISLFRAERLRDGPIATARLPYAIPLGLHGCFVAD